MRQADSEYGDNCDEFIKEGFYISNSYISYGKYRTKNA